MFGRLRAIIDSIDMPAIIATDAEGHIGLWSKGAQALFGWSEAEVLGQRLSTLVAANPEVAESLDAELDQVRRDGCCESQGWLRRQDGSRFWAKGRLSLLQDGSGGFARTVQDWTRQKQEEEALRESERRFRHFAESAPVLVWVSDANGVSLYRSPRWYSFTGTGPEDGLGLHWTNLLHPEDRDPVRDAFLTANRLRTTYQVEYRLRTADGSYRWMFSTAAPRFAEDGTYLGYVGCVIDIEDRRQAEERYRLAAGATRDAIWDWNIPGNRILRSEPATSSFDPAARLELRFEVWANHVHPEDRTRVLEKLQAFLAGTDTRWSDEYRYRRPDGRFSPVLDRGFLVRDPDGRPVRMVGAAQDLTERKNAEAELQRLQSELLHISRVSAMGTMASTLAHELNQPLTAVANYVRGGRRLLEKHGASGLPIVAEALDGAAAQALRAGQIVQRLRDLVARGEVSKRVESLAKIVAETEALAFSSRSASGISYEIRLDPACDHVLVDRIQIQQVLLNLIRNAVESMADSARRELTISSTVTPGGMVAVRVADTGPGIMSAVKDRIFSPFVTTKADGMGVGLSISRTIVEAHGGQMWVEESEAGGAILGFTIPRADRTEQGPERGFPYGERIGASRV